MARFKFLEDIATADIAFEAYGKTPEKLFKNAALALFETMTETEKVKVILNSQFLILNSINLEDLLFDFLSELVFLKDQKGMLFSKFKLEITPNKLGARSYQLKANIWGEKIDPSRHNLKVDVKAVTYYQFGIKKEKNKLTARVVLDI